MVGSNGWMEHIGHLNMNAYYCKHTFWYLFMYICHYILPVSCFPLKAVSTTILLSLWYVPMMEHLIMLWSYFPSLYSDMFLFLCLKYKTITSISDWFVLIIPCTAVTNLVFVSIKSDTIVGWKFIQCDVWNFIGIWFCSEIFLECLMQTWCNKTDRNCIGLGRFPVPNQVGQSVSGRNTWISADCNPDHGFYRWLRAWLQ